MICTLAGVPLNLVPEGISWGFPAGVSPTQRVIVCTNSRVRDMFAAGSGPHELLIQPDNFRPLKVQQVWVLQVIAVDENRTGLVVADRRWQWARCHLVRDYNCRRKTGDRRLVGNAMAPIQLQESIADYGYRRSTMKEGRLWTAKEILADLLEELVGSDYQFLSEPPWSATIQDLHLDDSGPSALARALAYMPGAAIYVHPDGKIRVFNCLDGSEEKAIASVGATWISDQWQGYWGGGTVVKVDRSYVRPTSVASLFEQECEIRFDYDETSTPTNVKGREARTLQQVIPTTDPTLTVSGKTVARGTYIPVADWFTSIAALSDAPATAAAWAPLNQARIRQHRISNLNILEPLFTVQTLPQPSILWSERFAALRQHWRMSYRINSAWLDKIQTFRARRVSILDQETGTRGKAQVWCDHVLKPTIRSLIQKRNDDPNTFAGWNVEGYNADLSQATPAPFDVSIEDSDAGLFSVVPRVDPFGWACMVAPGSVENFPSVAVGGKLTIWETPNVVLKAAFNLSVIFTCTRATPNDTDRLWRVEVQAKEPARGPVWEQRIGGGLDTARFAWLDSKAAEIEAAWFDGKPYPADLLVNKAIVEDIANANAERVYAFFKDRFEGELLVGLNPDVLPTGSMVSVDHVVTKDGATMTKLSLPPIQAPPDLHALLSESTRQTILRMVQP